MRREPRWVKVFLKQLERTGNVRLAAEGAGVDYTTAYQRRKRHGDFAEKWAGALAAHASRSTADEGGLHCGPSTIPSSGNGPPPRSGEDLVMRPDGVLIRGSDARWGKRSELAFLTELTVSGNVKRAAAAVGFSTTAVYKQRLKSRHFAAAWDAAIETGKARVQAFLVEAATRTFDPDELPIGDGHELPKVSISEAINIAKSGPSAGAARAGKGRDGHSDPYFDGWEVDHEEYLAARQRIIDRIQRLRDNMAADGWWEDDKGQLIPPGYARIEESR